MHRAILVLPVILINNLLPISLVRTLVELYNYYSVFNLYEYLLYKLNNLKFLIFKFINCMKNKSFYF